MFICCSWSCFLEFNDEGAEDHLAHPDRRTSSAPAKPRKKFFGLGLGKQGRDAVPDADSELRSLFEGVKSQLDYPLEKLHRWSEPPKVIPNPSLPGEGGKAVQIPPELEGESKRKFQENQFNVLASDLMSLNRLAQVYCIPKFVQHYHVQTRSCEIFSTDVNQM